MKKNEKKGVRSGQLTDFFYKSNLKLFWRVIMQWKFSFRDDGILEIKAKGVFKLDDFRALVLEMISDSEWKPGLNKLFDSSQ